MKHNLTLYLLIAFLCVAVSCQKTPGQEPIPSGPIPEIESITSDFDDQAVFDHPIVITGKNFSTEKSKNIVSFDGEKVTDILESSATEIVVKVPRIRRETSKVTVIADGRESKSKNLKFDNVRCDSVVVFAGANIEMIRAGVEWKSTITTWKGQPRSLNVITIAPSEVKNLGVAYPSELTKTSVQCEKAGAILGVNAQYFSGSRTREYLRIDGEEKFVGEPGRSTVFAGGALVLNEGKARIRKTAGNEGAKKLAGSTVMCAGPLLIEEGYLETIATNTTHNTSDHPRTVIGVKRDGSVILATIDGRFEGQAIGMPSTLVQEYMLLLGADSALNLDGGGSTTMWIKDNGVVNHTCDGSWDARVERRVSSILYLK